MKKTLLVLAVAAASVAAQAADTTTLYGSIGYKANFDLGNVQDTTKNALSDAFKAGLKSSSIDGTKIGVKGTEDLGNNVSAFFNYQLGLDADALTFDDKDKNGKPVDYKGMFVNNNHVKIAGSIVTTKKAFLGFQGNFGKITLGKQGKTFGDYTGKANFFNSDDVLGGWYDGSYGFTAGLRYDLPALAKGLSASAAYDLTAELAEVGVGYSVAGVDVGLAGQYSVNGATKLGQDTAKDNFRAGLSVAYSNDKLQAGVDYQFKPAPEKEFSDAFKKGNNVVSLGFGYNVTKSSTAYLGAQLDLQQFLVDKQQKKFQAGVGYTYNITDRTKAWVEAGVAVALKDDKNNFAGSANVKAAVGVKHSF